LKKCYFFLVGESIKILNTQRKLTLSDPIILNFLNNFELFEFRIIRITNLNLKFEFRTQIWTNIRTYSNSYSKSNNELFRYFSNRIRIMSELTNIVQADLVICGLIVCNFDILAINLFYGTYPLIYI
jgi:hypothetical protein